MLTFTEEILLLLLGEEDGAFLPVNSNAFECALAGAALMDLAFALRIDTDLESLIVLNENPTGISMLDGILAKIAAHPKVMAAQSWVRLPASDEAKTIREQALASLVARGILEQRERRRVGHYPMRDGAAQRAVKLHIREVLLADDIPDPRDVARVSLANACGVFPEILSEREIKQATPRIQQLRIMDLIGREVAGAIMSTTGTLIAVVVVVVMMVVGGDRRALLIGATTDAHHQLEMACETCHAAPVFADAQTAEKELNKTCRDCHEDALFHGSAPQPTAFAFSRTRRRRHVPATVARLRSGTQFTRLGPRAVNGRSWYSPGRATTLARCSRHSSRNQAGSNASPHCRARLFR